jgi:hypothetical protein
MPGMAGLLLRSDPNGLGFEPRGSPAPRTASERSASVGAAQESRLAGIADSQDICWTGILDGIINVRVPRSSSLEERIFELKWLAPRITIRNAINNFCTLQQVNLTLFVTGLKQSETDREAKATDLLREMRDSRLIPVSITRSDTLLSFPVESVSKQNGKNMFLE